MISADRGLAGAYASSIIRLAEAAMIAHRRTGREVRLFAVGKKALSYFDYRGYAVERSFLGITDTPGYGDARAIAATVMEAYAAGRVDAVETFSTRFDSMLTQTPVTFDLLPVQPPGADDSETAAVSYSYEPEPEEILDRLLPRYVEAIVYNMLLESSASEHSARRRAMKAATDNADELIRVLTNVANRARQAEITTEISEIVGGAEALNK